MSKPSRRLSEVAIKQVKREIVNESLLSEFWGECGILSKLRPHVNIVQFLGVCLNPLCIITEFLSNGKSNFSACKVSMSKAEKKR